MHAAARTTRKRLKHLLARFPNYHLARTLTHFPLFKQWQKAFVTSQTPTFRTREELFDFVLARYCPPEFLYLEFGCGSGAGIKYWAEKCKGRHARFVGFDTFTGLPEQWQCVGWSVDAGIWSLDGVPPAVDDDRVSFERGLFQDTLHSFLEKSDIAANWPFRVIHIDADLYSSTLFVLCALSPFLDGAIVLFDEFDCVLDEFRALEDFCKAFRKRYRVLAVSDWCEKVAIQFDALPPERQIANV